jgi:hypothetical protein
MKRVALLRGLVLVLPLAASSARADIPPPPADLPAGRYSTSYQIRFDPTKDVTILHLGRDVLEQAEADAKKAAPEKRSETSPGTTRSIVAATAMSLGLAGVLLLRGRRRSQIVCGLVLAAGLGAVGSEAWANLAPPPPAPSVPVTTQFNLGGNPGWIVARDGNRVFNGQIVVQLTSGNNVQLNVGTKALPQRTGRVGPPIPEPQPAPTSSKSEAK